MTTRRRGRVRTTSALSISAAAALLLALATRATPASASPVGQSTFAGAPAAADLKQAGPDQQRWLSLPNSRLVLNPDSCAVCPITPVQQNNGPDLPVAAGYYAADQASRVSPLLSMYQQPPGNPAPLIGFNDDFANLDPSWAADPWVHAQASNHQLEMDIPSSANSPAPFGAIRRTVQVNVDTHPIIQITVPKAVGAWAVKVNDGAQAVDSEILGGSGTYQTGTFTANLQQLTGWHGEKTFQIILFVVGIDQPIYVSDIRVFGNWLHSATTFTTKWLPYALPFQATYSDGMTASGKDYFYDTNSVVRNLTVANYPSDGSTVVLAGQYTGTVSWNPARQVITIRSAAYSYAITVSDAKGPPRFYASEGDLGAGGPILSSPGSSGAWALTLQPPSSGSLKTQVGVGFATAGEGTAAAVTRALASVAPGSTARQPEGWQRFWDNMLERAPEPADFSVQAVDSKGVTASDVRRLYYTAWVFVEADVLPAMPEAGYRYPQVSSGKPSLFLENSPGNPASAYWESLIGAQLLAYVDPETAWRAFQGLMSRIGPDGVQPGENLPSREAQTAWVLYSLTGDTHRLRAVYPALKRLLLWQEQNPRWITIGGNDYPGEWDSSFASEALVGLNFAQDIANALDLSSDASFWQQQFHVMLQTFYSKFFTTPTSAPVEYNFPNDPNCAPRGGCTGVDLWVAEGLHIPGIAQPYEHGIEQRFLDSYNPGGSFSGFEVTKYPDLSYAIYGLLENGMSTEAQVMVNAAIRDTTRTNAFAESYSPTDPPQATGLIPDVFGAANVIDNVWIKNGYRMDEGPPHFVLMRGEEGGITGLNLLGHTINLQTDASSGQVTLSGSLVRDTPGCRILHAALGHTIALPQQCINR